MALVIIEDQLDPLPAQGVGELADQVAARGPAGQDSVDRAGSGRENNRSARWPTRSRSPPRSARPGRRTAARRNRRSSSARAWPAHASGNPIGPIGTSPRTWPAKARRSRSGTAAPGRRIAFASSIATSSSDFKSASADRRSRIAIVLVPLGSTGCPPWCTCSTSAWRAT